jgi:hypothetical protein
MQQKFPCLADTTLAEAMRCYHRSLVTWFPQPFCASRPAAKRRAQTGRLRWSPRTVPSNSWRKHLQAGRGHWCVPSSRPAHLVPAPTMLDNKAAPMQAQP